jgi:hypothetical protein
VQRTIITFLFISILFIPLLLNGQQKYQPVFDHSLRYDDEYLDETVGKTETSLNLLVVMVEFQTDNDSRTTGDGFFDLRDTIKRFLDAPPRNQSYFSNHLTFLKNYYEKVSDGKLNISYRLLDSIYRLPYEMKHYSPSKTSKKNIELGWLVHDTWKLVDSVSIEHNQPINFSDYNAYVIFHAGVGRDIDLATIYGYDPTPYDLPSLYVNLKTMFEDTLSLGVPVDSGRFYIANSMILPETETRSQVPFPLGINGLLVASVASHLGLPDLFNTKDGRSAIGRFGLMDGQSIFSWNGAFPPEPCAWEKQYLGWIKPIEIKSSDSVFYLPAKSLFGSADTTYKVNISASEYFLIENRNRDANRDGAIVTMIAGNDTIRKQWLKDTTHFNASYQDSLYGVIIDVDDFDWSLPGGVDSRTKTFYDGGILIWHIDETIINSKLGTNSINADPKKRGVNLMEADGSPDIGQSYDLLHPGSGSESGTALDFWFDGNSAPLRKYDSTGFTPTSYPNSMSNTGANSHIYINRFSERGPRMSARVKIGDEQIIPLRNFPKYIGSDFKPNSLTVTGTESGIPSILVSANRVVSGYQLPSIFGWKLDGSPLIDGMDSSGRLAYLSSVDNKFIGKIAVSDFSGDLLSDMTIGCSANENLIRGKLLGWSMSDKEPDHIIDPLFLFDVTHKITTSPVVSDSFIAYGSESGYVYFVQADSILAGAGSIKVFDSASVVGLNLISDNKYLALSAIGEARITSLYPNQVLGEIKNFGHPFNSPAVSGLLSGNNYWKNEVGSCIVFASTDGYVFLTDSQLNPLNGYPVSTNGMIVNAPAIGDVDGDNIKDIVVFSGNKIYAFNATGALVDNFPIIVATGQPILASPVLGDVDGDRSVDIVAATQEGLIVAYNKQGKMVTGFPLLSGPNSGATPAIFYMQSLCLSCVDIGLAVGSDDGNVYAWKTGSLATGLLSPPIIPWPQYLHDAKNTGMSYDVLTPISKSDNFLPSERAYNWPNPVTATDGFKTHIRYYIKDDANVKIKIIDPAGDLVAQFETRGIGGIDNEVEWNASALQSGVYFVHIEASSSSANGHSIIKMAIVR